jgi:rhizoxin synthesis polyketide synthase/nonribosomal peptide synthetase RhiB
VGRQAKNERLGLIAGELPELLAKLRSVSTGSGGGGVFRGQVRSHRQLHALFADDDVQHVVDRWLAKGQHDKLLELWVHGFDIDWTRLYHGKTPRRVRLPGYPFARERHWLAPPRAAARGGRSVLHPLLHENTSDLEAQRFTSLFDGTEPFLEDHRVGGQRVLPGVAYLELARAGLRFSTPAGQRKDHPVELRDVVWSYPLFVPDDGAGVEFHVEFVRDAEDEGGVTFEAYTVPAGAEDRRVYCQGKVRWGAARPPPALDVRAWQARLDRLERRTGQACYDAFERLGLGYGPSHRGLQALYRDGNEVLARLVLAPEARSPDASSWVLHPGLADAALQAAMVFVLDEGRPYLPFSTRAVEIHAPCPAEAWVHVVRRTDHPLAVDVSICDGDGAVCVRMHEVTARPMQSGPQLGDGLECLLPVWEPLRPEERLDTPRPARGALLVIGADDASRAAISREHAARFLDLDTGRERLAAAFTEHAALSDVVWIAPRLEAMSPSDERLIDGQERGVMALLSCLQAAIATVPSSRPLRFTIVTRQAWRVGAGEPLNATHASLAGVVGSAAKEHPHWDMLLVDLPAEGALSLDELWRLPPDPSGDGWALRHGQWHRQVLVPLRQLGEGPLPYRQGGVYVIIGGAGGIGEVFTRHVIRHHAAQVIWLGRRELDSSIEAKLDALGALGPRPSYIRADATRRADLERARDQIKRQFGAIHAVIHSAIVLDDRPLAAMETERFRRGLAAKVDSSVRLAQVFEGEPLDFVLFFSSMQTFSKAPGQSNYAAGSTFIDAFAQQLGQAWSCRVRVIDWGYWGSVGVVSDESHRRRMARAGFGSIEPDSGMRALDAALAAGFERVAILKPTGRLALTPLWEDAWAGAATSPEPRAALPEVRRVQASPELIELGRRHDEIDALAAEPLLAQLTACGATPPVELPGLAPRFRRWWAESGRLLEERGLAGPGAGWDRWARAAASWAEDPRLRARVALMDTCLRALPDVLLGRRQATDVLFPGASTALIEGVYKGEPLADAANARLAEAMLEAIAPFTRGSGRGLRILEIGAGTGACTAGVLAGLKAREARVETYVYSDVSQVFLRQAQARFAAEAPFLEPRLFDVSRPLSEQGFTPGTFDVVLAANALHATSDIRRALRNAKALLRRGGVLLVSEISQNSLFAHLTFGLLEGWWLHTDSPLRIHGCPGLRPEAWRELLSQEGFLDARFVAAELHALGHQVIACVSDGVYLQQPETAPAPPSRRRPEPPAAPASAPTEPARPRSAEPLRARTLSYLKRTVASIFDLRPDQLDAAEPFASYGIDSILVVKLANALSKIFRDVTTTLFFELQTLEELADHLLATQPDRLAELLGAEQAPPEVARAPAPVARNEPAPQVGRRRAPRPMGRAVPVAETGGREIAIIGMSGRFPGADTVGAFWENLRAGVDSVTEIPADRWRWQAQPDSHTNRWGGFLSDVDAFDPLFFEIAPREAERMGPQERLFLQEAYRTLEDAGYTPRTLSSTRQVGVFVGVMNDTYSAQPAHWSVANRVSFAFDLRGPSLAVDTACSSSLSALHLAVESLLSGTSECAIAGGVNLILHPLHLRGLSQAGMLSPRGRCQAFGEGADGFVDAEAVGAVLLKPLDRALADGDQIHGVIRSTMINAGGRTNGYTVPNPKAQAEVLQAALRRGGVDPRHVSYIEAHGTGTSLGDPIEISALSRAFSSSVEGAGAEPARFCAIGSVKSNLGHAESAAGIVGLIKVLLQMKHRQLAPTLHAAQPNPRIDFARTPFKVQQVLSPWERPVLEEGGRRFECPRIAGVSSFGAGGANAHVIVEEYSGEPSAPPEAPPVPPHIVLLSAKQEAELVATARNLLDFLSRAPEGSVDLAALAFTLQVGREHHEERLAMTAGSLEELREKLQGFVERGGRAEGVIRGRSESERATPDVDEELGALARTWVRSGKHHKLLPLWARGLGFDWRALYEGGVPRRISLPTYPFAKERYWKPGREDREAERSASHEPGGQKVFPEDDPLFADHVVRGQGILPGAVFLEMARAAVSERATPPSVVRLLEVAWPAAARREGRARQVRLDLRQDASGAFEFEASSESGSERVSHCRGQARLEPAARPDALDIADLCRRAGEPLDGAKFYERFARLGIQYGPLLRAVQSVFIGESFAAARLRSPATRDRDRQVALIDAALQAVLALAGEGQELHLPFSLRRVTFHAPCPADAWAVARPSAGTARPQAPVFDVDLCDASGNVCVRLEGFSIRAPRDPGSRKERARLYREQWREVPVLAESGGAEPASFDAHHVVLFGFGADHREVLEKSGLVTRCEHVTAPTHGLARDFERIALQALDTVKSGLRESKGGAALFQFVVPRQEHATYRGLVGLVRTLGQENPSCVGQLIEVDAAESPSGLVRKLRDNRRWQNAFHVRYEAGRRFISASEALAVSTEPPLPWKVGGVYLVTGGAGALGSLFAREIARLVPEATIILVGRRPLTGEQRRSLEALGARVRYREADVARRDDVVALVRSIRDEHGPLCGVIHAAGVLRDAYLPSKTPEQAREVLRPKVAGAVNLDEATKDVPLDFFVMFSSAAGVLGNAGQADYAMANAFLDGYAEHRNALVSSGHRSGRTLSLAWPLWAEGGMTLDEAHRADLERSIGLTPMPTGTGLRSFYEALSTEGSSVLVLHGDPDRLAAAFAEPKPRHPPREPGPARGSDETLQSRLLDHVHATVCASLQVEPQRLGHDAALSRFGLDSIVALEVTRRLEDHFPGLPKTLLFDRGSVRELADYLWTSRREDVSRAFGDALPARPQEPEAEAPPPRPAEPQGDSPEQLYRQGKIGLDELVRRVGRAGVRPVPPGKEAARPEARLIHESELDRHPSVAQQVERLERNGLAVAYEAALYPYIFLNRAGDDLARGHLIDEARLFVPYLPVRAGVYGELLEHARSHGLQVLLVDRYHEWAHTADTKLLPLGVWQDLPIQGFSLGGRKMRKLRYLVEKFRARAGARVEEYDASADLPLRQMRDLMARWSEAKGSVIRHSLDCMQELLGRRLRLGYRAFLTYDESALCSIIVIGEGEPGYYVMDQEFYDPATAPLGHMEYAIVEIMERLGREGAHTFSLGLTWYPFGLEEDPRRDSEGWAWLQRQAEDRTLLGQIFEQARSNHQFKSKFGVEGEQVYAYLPRAAPPSVVQNYWPLFSRNSRPGAEVASRLGEPVEDAREHRQRLLADHALHALATEQVPLDLITDSWFSVRSRAVARRAFELRRCAPPAETSLTRWLPFEHLVPFSQGRTAEQVFYRALFERSAREGRRRIVGSIPWLSTLQAQLESRFEVIELPSPEVLSHEPLLFRGELDLAALERHLGEAPEKLAMVGLEVLSNASGGHPVRLDHVRRVRALLEPHGVPLVLDASRVVRNAMLLRRHGAAGGIDDLWSIVTATLELADHVVMSLSKDFGMPRGGVIATRDASLMQALSAAQAALRLDADPEVLRLARAALHEREPLERLLDEQLEFARRLGQTLDALGVPTLRPAEGHAVVVDTSAFPEGRERLLERLFVETGIRGAVHHAGKQRNNRLGHCVRLALPLGLEAAARERILSQLQRFFSELATARPRP